jgi:hypothetical protein
MTEKPYCRYCRMPKPEGTKFYVVRDKYGRKVNRKCETCKDFASKPVAERDARGRVVAAMEKKKAADFAQAMLELKRQQELSKKREGT